jgi:hypothetical protein
MAELEKNIRKQHESQATNISPELNGAQGNA